MGLLQELVYSHSSRESRILPAPMADLLKRCRSFDTLEGHAEALVDELMLDPDQVPTLLDQLRSLAEQRLLVSRQEIGRNWAQIEDPATPVEIENVAMVTCDRVESARRCFDSTIRSLKERGRTPRYLVFDDTRDRETAYRYREMLGELTRALGVPISYAGREEKQRLAGWLTEAGLPAPVVQFALFGLPPCQMTVGANHNAELLTLAGEPFINMDDDTLCRIAKAPERADGIELFSRADPTQLWYYPDRQAALAAEDGEPTDVLAMHRRFLGQSLRGCVQSCGGVASLVADQASPRILAVLDRDGGKVLATMTGLMGDSGMEVSSYNLLRDGASLDRLTRSGASYQRLAYTREVRRTVLRPTLSEGLHLMTPNIALDNRLLLPPFFPVQRNQDGIFGATIRLLFPEGYVGFLPYMVAHEPLQGRASSRKDNLIAFTRMRAAEILIQLILAFELPGGTWLTAERTRALGYHLVDLGALAPTDFADVVSKRLARLVANQVSMFDRMIEENEDRPEFWIRDVEEYRDTLLDAAIDPDYALPRDLAALVPPKQALPLMQELVRHYGELLILWPDMVQTARSLRAEDRVPFTILPAE
ncbi:MAG: hypothetical protein JW797_20130 [Bradymonadales bacterium]|nr:hypothetical protein [Bradymonadales bacterium]